MHRTFWLGVPAHLSKGSVSTLLEYSQPSKWSLNCLRRVLCTQAVGWQVRAKEGTRDLCVRLWHKAWTKAGELGIPRDALAGLPCFIRRPLETYYLLGLKHVQTLYLLATEAQR